MSEHIGAELDRVERRYDPENDLPRNEPEVTFTDKALLDAIKDLRDRVAILEGQGEEDGREQ